MDLEIIILSGVSQTGRQSYDVIYMWNLKKGIQMNLFAGQTDSRTLKNLWLPNETGLG